MNNNSFIYKRLKIAQMNHPLLNLIDNFDALSSITIVCNDKLISLPKFMLGYIPLLNKMISSNCKENIEKSIKLDIDYDVLKLCLKMAIMEDEMITKNIELFKEYKNNTIDEMCKLYQYLEYLGLYDKCEYIENQLKSIIKNNMDKLMDVDFTKLSYLSDKVEKWCEEEVNKNKSFEEQVESIKKDDYEKLFQAYNQKYQELAQKINNMNNERQEIINKLKQIYTAYRTKLESD